jgi:hypothetical protein
MCLAVYIASNQELPLIAFDKARPAFYVGELSSADGDVRRQFTLPNVRYAGSNEGCGCGFLKDGVVGDELIQTQQNYTDLGQYITPLLENGGVVELFACWEGDQPSPKESSEEIDVQDLVGEDFEFREKYFYQVIAT